MTFRIKKSLLQEKSQFKEQNCADRASLLNRDFTGYADEEKKNKESFLIFILPVDFFQLLHRVRVEQSDKGLQERQRLHQDAER